MNILYNTL